ncbi:MAG: hypothetical protein JWO10_2062, partial [Microbacteriaceae bacterium]|nr:hypothetical protein [Microbacteriaceae bacterium]
MTAWQDEPPLSRRQARQNERGDSVDASSVDQLSGEVPMVDAPAFGGFEGWDAQARAAQAPAVTPPPAQVEPAAGSQTADPQSPESQAVEPQASGRRSRRAYVPVEAEPLEYNTQGRQLATPEDQGTLRPRSTRPDADSASLTPTDTPEAQAPAYRVRDFSPEGRRTAFTSTTPEPSWAPPAGAGPAAGPLDYFTQASPAPVQAEPVQAEPAQVEPAQVDPVQPERAQAEPEPVALAPVPTIAPLAFAPPTAPVA